MHSYFGHIDQKLPSTQSQRHAEEGEVKLSELLEIDETILISIDFVHEAFKLSGGVGRANGFKNIAELINRNHAITVEVEPVETF